MKASKTDPLREGATLLIASTGTSLCPVSALKHYLKYSKVSQGPLFQFSDGRFLTWTLISLTVHKALSNQGLDIKRYSSHSFRIGAASAASAAGLSDSLMKSLGRWRSSCYQRYIKLNVDTLQEVPHRLISMNRVGKGLVPLLNLLNAASSLCLLSGYEPFILTYILNGGTLGSIHICLFGHLMMPCLVC